MSKRIIYYIAGWIACGLLLISMTGCKPNAPIPTQTPDGSVETPMPPTTAVPPEPSPTLTSTDVPLAARVAGIGISLAEYQAALNMVQAAKGIELAPEDEQLVLDDLIDQALLAQAAEENGFTVDSTLIESRIKKMIDQLGSQQALESWQTTYQYDDSSFRRALQLSIAAAWMRDQIAAGVPKTAEQVHARQILTYNSDEANEIYLQLQAGNSFQNLALKYDPVTGGDLGWFPRGYLPASQIEDAAFSLQPEAYSQVIETSAGYHIVQVMERDPERLLSPDALLVLQTIAVQDWLVQHRSESQIEILLP